MKQEKSKKRKKSERQKDTAPPGNPNVGYQEDASENGRMDFGGLPNRDLKKNLGGCG